MTRRSPSEFLALPEMATTTVKPSILPKANLRDSLQMAYLLQLYRQENSLKYRPRNKLLIDDIHITITEGRGCVAEGKAKKKKKPMPKKHWTWEGECTV